MTRIFLTEMIRLRMHPKLSGGRGGGRRVWKIVHSVVLATLLCMTADEVFHWLKQKKYIYCQFYKVGGERLEVTRKVHR